MWSCQGAADLAGQLRDLGDDRLQGADEAEHDLAAGFGLERGGAPIGGAPQPGEQFVRRASAGVVVASQEAPEALFAESAGVGRGRVAFEERQRDRAVDLGEDRHRAGPEALKLGAQRVGQRDAGLDEILARTGQRAQRLGGVGVGDQDAEAMAVGARQLGEHERVEAVALAARRAKPRPAGGDLVGMHGDHVQPGVQQPLDQQAVGALNGDQQHAELDQPVAQRAQSTLVMTVSAALGDPPVGIDDTHRVLLAGPVHTGEPALIHNSSCRSTLTVAGGEVPWRVLTDGALTAQLPVATRGTSTERREALVSSWPSARASDAGALPTSAGNTRG